MKKLFLMSILLSASLLFVKNVVAGDVIIVNETGVRVTIVSAKFKSQKGQAGKCNNLDIHNHMLEDNQQITVTTDNCQGSGKLVIDVHTSHGRKKITTDQFDKVKGGLFLVQKVEGCDKYEIEGPSLEQQLTLNEPRFRYALFINQTGFAMEANVQFNSVLCANVRPIIPANQQSYYLRLAELFLGSVCSNARLEGRHIGANNRNTNIYPAPNRYAPIHRQTFIFRPLATIPGQPESFEVVHVNQ